MKSKYAMTGEITLTGKILPIGGLKEKSLAAARHKKEKVIIPYENKKDIEELPKTIRNKIEFITVKRATDVFKMVFDESILKKGSNSLNKSIDVKSKKDEIETIITQ